MQLSLFDGNNEFKIKKPIRLIELFAGYGSQHLALKYLGVEVESYKICEWAVKSIQAYKDLHFENDTKDYSVSLTAEEVISYLANKGISSNYNEPMKIEQVRRLGESKCRQIYNNIQATHNLVNITQVHATDLNIVDTDKYDYIMTYSFPCQDLSKAGKGKGMEKDGGTRSGLLWEVERILDECNGNLPKVLLMENVPDVIGSKNIKHFAKWLEKLESLGYYCKWQILNAKDYRIPQNRERCFMVSILADNVYYDFPKKQKLEFRLKDLLEDNVDEKYYLSDNIIKYFESHTQECVEKGNGFRFEPKDGNCVAKAITTRAGSRMDDNFISNEETLKLLSKNKAIKETIENKDLDNGYFLDFYNRTINKNGVANAITTRIDASTTSGVVVANNSIQLKRELCNNLIQKNLVKENDVIRQRELNIIDTYNKKVLEDNSIIPTIPAGYNRNQGGVIMEDNSNICSNAVVGLKRGYSVEIKLEKEDTEEVDIIGNYSKSNFSQTPVVGKNGIAPTFTENHGEVTAICEQKDEMLKRQLCNFLIENGECKEMDVIKHNYTEQIINGNKKCSVANNESPTLDTRCDCLGVCVNVEPKIVEPMVYDIYNKKQIINGICGTLTTYGNSNFTSCGTFGIKQINDYRIRKLTPKECWRLMGVRDEDYEKVAKNQSNTSLYHLAGDSIVVNVLMEIFSKMVEKEKI